MAGLARSAKDASDWTSYDLAAYNIVVRRKSAKDFFGYILPDTIPETIDPAFLTATVPPDDDDLSDTTYRLLQYIHLATNPDSGQESAIYDVSRELLRSLGFEEQGILLRSRYPIPFMINGDTGRVAQTGMCLMHGSSTILLVIQEDSAVISGKDPEAQVVAEGIAAFQYNNAARDRAGLDRIRYMDIPAIIMTGTRPIFYKIDVSQALSEAVAMGQYPVRQTTVHKCIVAHSSGHLSEGMEVPEVRRDILRYCEAFREMSKECWGRFIA